MAARAACNRGRSHRLEQPAPGSFRIVGTRFLQRRARAGWLRRWRRPPPLAWRAVEPASFATTPRASAVRLRSGKRLENRFDGLLGVGESKAGDAPDGRGLLLPERRGRPGVLEPF